MNNLSINKAHRLFLLLAFCSTFLFGCNSTPDKEVETNCRTETNENCTVEDENGDDRGYNPCLVNKNLPVCKK
jgi:hypothetical protein